MSRGRHAKHLAGGLVPVLVIVLTVLVLLGGGATLAAYRYDRDRADRILPGISIDGVDVGRMTRAEAIAAVRAQASLRLDSKVTVRVANETWSATEADLGVRADVGGAVDEALAASRSMSMVSRVYHRLSNEPVQRSITVGWRFGQAKVEAFVEGIAEDVAVSPTNASAWLDGTQLRFQHAKAGRALKSDAATARILRALESASSSRVQLATKQVTPKITDEELGSTIVIDKQRNTLALYDGFELDREYDVATAIAPYETPSGTWTIINKAKHPTWTNPAPDTWGAGLPLSIPPGPGNPLGTRALYLNAPGIRIHGTYDSDSIGTHASHGCIRMNIDDVEELYPLVPIGSKVLVY